jgi:hypothetical protein
VTNPSLRSELPESIPSESSLSKRRAMRRVDGAEDEPGAFERFAGSSLVDQAPLLDQLGETRIRTKRLDVWVAPNIPNPVVSGIGAI